MESLKIAVKIENPMPPETDASQYWMEVGNIPYGTIVDWSQGRGENLCMLVYNGKDTAKLVSLAYPGCTYTVRLGSRVWVVGFPRRLGIKLWQSPEQSASLSAVGSEQR